MRVLRKFFFIMFCCLVACSYSTDKLHPLKPGATILAFGDSITYGIGASTSTSYPADLAQLTGFNVINSGVPGEESKEGLARISGELEKYHPELVILCLGGNDLLKKRPQQDIKENLRKIIAIIQAQGIQVVMIAVPEPSLTLHVPDFYRELGQELDVPVDTTTLPGLYRERKFKSDYVHFNQEGYKFFARDVVRFLKEEGGIVVVHGQ